MQTLLGVLYFSNGNFIVLFLGLQRMGFCPCSLFMSGTCSKDETVHVGERKGSEQKKLGTRVSGEAAFRLHISGVRAS